MCLAFRQQWFTALRKPAWTISQRPSCCRMRPERGRPRSGHRQFYPVRLFTIILLQTCSVLILHLGILLWISIALKYPTESITRHTGRIYEWTKDCEYSYRKGLRFNKSPSASPSLRGMPSRESETLKLKPTNSSQLMRTRQFSTRKCVFEVPERFLFIAMLVKSSEPPTLTNHLVWHPLYGFIHDWN